MSSSMEETFNCIYDARVPPLWEKVRTHKASAILYKTWSSFKTLYILQLHLSTGYVFNHLQFFTYLIYRCAFTYDDMILMILMIMIIIPLVMQLQYARWFS